MTDLKQSFPDESHINRVREALAVRPISRASVMVGSGFSRNAIKTRVEVDDLPLWDGIAKSIFDRLYPEKEENANLNPLTGRISADSALRLAQEYKSAFGRADLHGLLVQLVRDQEFEPSDKHNRLLKLPWRDVFTTNWDTLLERASQQIAVPGYSWVKVAEQLPLVSQPRIVKLHGSFDSTFPLIFTEEDYRTYPTEYAPFVNSVQQAMMETVFFLIGFSGDDPNFLNWSGWVRDNLRDSAPKIYLAGWLQLSTHRRRMLEERGVVPIDLAAHPKAPTWPSHLIHEYATEWLIQALERGRPYDQRSWPSQPKHANIVPVPIELEPLPPVFINVPKRDLERNYDRNNPFAEDEPVDRVRQIMSIWQHNRKLYPGWLVYPNEHRTN